MLVVDGEHMLTCASMGYHYGVQVQLIRCDGCGATLPVPAQLPADFYEKSGQRRHGWALNRRDVETRQRLDFCAACPDTTVRFAVVSRP